jgi:hypothetical protein
MMTTIPATLAQTGAGPSFARNRPPRTLPSEPSCSSSRRLSTPRRSSSLRCSGPRGILVVVSWRFAIPLL